MVQLKWPGGKDNFAVDRSAGDQVMALRPEIIARSARKPALPRSRGPVPGAEEGIRQFLCIGTGLPSSNNTPQGRADGGGFPDRLRRQRPSQVGLWTREEDHRPYFSGLVGAREDNRPRRESLAMSAGLGCALMPCSRLAACLSFPRVPQSPRTRLWSTTKTASPKRTRPEMKPVSSTATTRGPRSLNLPGTWPDGESWTSAAAPARYLRRCATGAPPWPASTPAPKWWSWPERLGPEPTCR